VLPVKFTSNYNKHDVFRSASNAARDFPGRIRHRDFLNSRVQYVGVQKDLFSLVDSLHGKIFSILNVKNK
jgi:hypothetical protein